MKTNKKVLAGAVLAAALTAGTAIACAPPPAPPAAPQAPRAPKAPAAYRHAPPTPPAPPAPPSLDRLAAAEARLEAAVEELTAAIEARTAGLEADIEARTAAIEAAVEARVEASRAGNLQRIADARLSPVQIREIRESARIAAEEGARAAADARAMVEELQPQIAAIKAEAAELRRACLAGEIECTVIDGGRQIIINRDRDD